MPPDRDLVCLWQMLQAARGVVASLEKVSLEQYRSDENLRLAIERRVEIIGEAARRVSDELKLAHPEIPWRPIIEQRHILAHVYDAIDDERIWRLAFDDIPQLIEQVAPLLPPPPPDPEPENQP
jgi:uncharacterized protein with HEPN domain